jgi:hypothetical protein
MAIAIFKAAMASLGDYDLLLHYLFLIERLFFYNRNRDVYRRYPFNFLGKKSPHKFLTPTTQTILLTKYSRQGKIKNIE